MVLLLAVPIALAATEAKPTSAVVVTVAKAEKIQLVDQISYPGKIISRVKASIASPADGVVISITGPIGTKVAPGAAILKIRNLDPVFEYVPVNVEAPVGGIISLLEVTVGSRVAKGQILGTITDPRQSLLTIEVPGADLGKISLNMIGELHLRSSANATDANTHKLKVVGVSPLLDEVTGTALVELAPVNAGANLPIGTVGKIVFSANARKGFSLDESALVYRGKDIFVRKLVDGKAKFVKVDILQSRNGNAEIAAGITEGDTLIVRTTSFVDDNQEVVVKESTVATKK
jgi:multidrug efflux pump subunit AcrA (membrane-fusion protein)